MTQSDNSMLAETVKSVFPFVPAKDFESASQFYKDVGFECNSQDPDVRAFRLGEFGFLLQNFYVEDWANNFMMNIHVEDIERWHQHLVDSKITEKHEGTRLSPPKLEDWGMIVMHLIDPTGILWHITQNPD